MLNFKNTKLGISILGLLFVGSIIFFLLSYFKINIRDVMESPTGKENTAYVKGTSKGIWDKYLERPLTHFWNDIWLEIFWKPFVSDVDNIKERLPESLDNSAPKVKSSR